MLPSFLLMTSIMFVNEKLGREKNISRKNFVGKNFVSKNAIKYGIKIDEDHTMYLQTIR